MRGRDDDVAALARHDLAALDLDLEPEHSEQDEPGDQRQRTGRAGTPWPRAVVRASRDPPTAPPRAAGEGLGRDPTRRRPPSARPAGFGPARTPPSAGSVTSRRPVRRHPSARAARRRSTRAASVGAGDSGGWSPCAAGRFVGRVGRRVPGVARSGRRPLLRLDLADARTRAERGATIEQRSAAKAIAIAEAIWAVGIPPTRPVVAGAHELEQEAGRAVPDEEDQQEVTRRGAGSRSAVRARAGRAAR